MLRLDAFNVLSKHPQFANTSVCQMLRKNLLGFVDVGARGGVHDYVMALASLTNVVGFEPDMAECQRVENSKSALPWAKFHMLPYALGESAADKTLHLLSAATNHSLLPPNSLYVNRYNMQKNWTLVGQESLSTVTLDHVFKTELPEFFADFIKLDTQGTEYEILLGSHQTLTQQTTAIVCEVAFCELYKGQKLFSEVEMLLRDYQFSFYGFMPIHTRSKKILDKTTHVTKERALYADAVFFKDPLSDPAIQLSQRQWVALLSAAILLGYFDFALELVSQTQFELHLSEREILSQLIREISHLDPRTTRNSLGDLVAIVDENHAMANILVGNFVDRRRHFCDYDDVLNVSPLPNHYEASCD